MTGKDAYSRAVSGTGIVDPDQDAARRSELNALVTMNLGSPLDSRTFDSLALIQFELWATRNELNLGLDAGALSPEGYLARLNSALRVAMERSEGLLGRERFEAIFGETGRQPDKLVDRETFLAEARGHPN